MLMHELLLLPIHVAVNGAYLPAPLPDVSRLENEVV